MGSAVVVMLSFLVIRATEWIYAKARQHRNITIVRIVVDPVDKVFSWVRQSQHAGYERRPDHWK